MCAQCIIRRTQGVRLLPNAVKTLPALNLSREDHRKLAHLPRKFGSLRELKAFHQDGIDLGMAVSSSLITRLRDPDFDTTAHAVLIHQFLVATLAVYCSVRNYLKQYHVDRAYVFNGRLAFERAAMRACEHAGVECVTHELGQDVFHYALFRNAVIHDPKAIERLSRAAWAAAERDPRREEIASSFFIERAEGNDRAGPSFILGQKKGLLPSNWDATRPNIAVFNSSDDEFAAIGTNWDNPLYRDQLDGVRRIIRSLDHANPDRLHLYLRMHPNFKNAAPGTVAKWRELRSPHLTLIDTESPVSTYALMLEADKVLTFMSTTGIEGVYWGKPVILAGPSLYRSLGGTYNPGTHEELIRLMAAGLLPKDRTPALMYGYFLKTFGIPFEHYRATGFKEGKFLGEDVGWRPIQARLVGRLGRSWLRSWLKRANDVYVRRQLFGTAVSSVSHWVDRSH